MSCLNNHIHGCEYYNGCRICCICYRDDIMDMCKTYGPCRTGAYCRECRARKAYYEGHECKDDKLVESKKSDKEKKAEGESEEEEEEEEEVEETGEKVEKKKTKRQKAKDEKEAKSLSMKKRKLGPDEEGYDPYDFDTQEDEEVPATAATRRKAGKPKASEEEMETDEAPKAPKTGLSVERLQIFRSTLQGVFSEKHAHTLLLTEIVDRLNKDYPDAKFSKKEVDAAVHQMTEDNQIMLSDGTVFLV